MYTCARRAARVPVCPGPACQLGWLRQKELGGKEGTEPAASSLSRHSWGKKKRKQEGAGEGEKCSHCSPKMRMGLNFPLGPGPSSSHRMTKSLGFALLCAL